MHIRQSGSGHHGVHSQGYPCTYDAANINAKLSAMDVPVYGTYLDGDSIFSKRPETEWRNYFG